MMNAWIGVAQTLVGGVLFIAGLLAWHVATGDVWGFLAALASAGFMWIAGNLLVTDSAPSLYLGSVVVSLVAAIASALFVGI